MGIEFCSSGGGGGGSAPDVENFVVAANPADGTLMDLSWDDHPSEMVYVIDKSTDGITYVFDGIAAAAATTYQATGLSLSTQYWFRIRAVTNDGISNWAIGNDTTTAYMPIATAVDPAGMDSRWRADDFNDITGELPDKEGTGIDLAPINIGDELPALTADWRVGEPGILFDGVNNRLNHGYSSGGVGDGYLRRQTVVYPGHFGVLLVGDVGDISIERVLYAEACQSGSGAYSTIVRIQTDGSILVRRTGSSNSDVTSAASVVTIDEPFVIAVRVSTTTVDVWYNRTQVITAGTLDGNGQSCNLVNRTLGALSSFSSPDSISPHSGIISECIVWDTPPAEATFLNYRDALHNYYAIPY